MPGSLRIGVRKEVRLTRHVGLELLSKETPQSDAKQTAALVLGNLGLMCSEGRRAGRLGLWRQEALKRVWCLHPAPLVTHKTNSNPGNKYKEGQFSGLAHDDYFDGFFWEISYSLKSYFYSHFWVSPTCQLLSVCLVCLVGHP